MQAKINDRELADRYRAILELMSDAVVVRSANGQIVDLNQRAQQLFDVERGDVIGCSMPLPPWPGFRENGERILESTSFGVLALQSGTRQGGVVRFEVPSRAPKWLVVNASPLFDEHGKVIGVLKAMTDISSLRVAEATIIEQQAQRDGVHEPNVLSALLHELRTPLNAVLGFSKLVQSRPAVLGDEKSLRYINHVHDAARHMDALINNLDELGLSGAGQLNVTLAEAPVYALVCGVVDWLQARAARASVSVVIAPADEGLLAKIDALLTRQILLNIVSNAIKYNRANGWIRVGIASQGNWVVVSVEDSGYGMAPEELERLFVPYSRPTKESLTIEGTGLGLAISRVLVHSMGGEINVESEKGRGSIFRVRLPKP